MLVSRPNEHGVLTEGHRETLAERRRARATIKFALCEDGAFRYGLSMTYSHGGFYIPIMCDDQGYPTMESAREAAIEELLGHMPQPFLSDPTSVHAELSDLREQIEGHLRQPSLF